VLTEHAQVHPDRRGARPAVERKRDRAFGFVLDIIFGIGGKEDLRLGLFALRFLFPIGCFLFQHHRPGDDGVFMRLPVDGERVLGLDQVVDRGRFFFLFPFALAHTVPVSPFGP